MKKLISICMSACVLLIPAVSNACSMYKVTKDGKTIVGNNEDWLSPNSQFWFEQGEEGTYGVMYMGQLDGFAQGAINEAGLMFDGFSEGFLAVENTEGKLDISLADALRNVMQTMTTCEEAQAYLLQVDLSLLQTGQVVFVDPSGTYLIIEGDEMILGEEAEKSFSNFYYSQINSLDEVPLPYFQSGMEFVNESVAEVTLDYCGKAMKEFSQEGIAPTQYTTVYDLETRTVRVYLFHDFEAYVDIDLMAELKKGNHDTMIADLFPDDTAGRAHYLSFNDAKEPTKLLRAFLADHDLTEEDYLSNGFDYVINSLGYEWLYDLENTEGAIKVFTYGTELMPSSANLHDSLGEAYFEAEQWEEAIESYKMAVTLNPENEAAVAKIAEAEAKRTSK